MATAIMPCMESPFPGMDPYVEARWLDLHARLIVLAGRSLQRQLGEDLVASIEERIVVEDTLGYSRGVGPDVRVVEVEAPLPSASHKSSGNLLVAEPIRLSVLSEPISERYLQIIDPATGGRVITVIEFVSPTNKLPGDGRRQFVQKQEECYNAKVNLVEIDLTRRGDRKLLCHRWARAREFDATYQVSSWRAAWGSEVELYPISLRQRLPAIAIPLRPEDRVAVLDLQAIFHECYADARYDRTTNYREPCDPPLEGDDAVWADQLLRGAGRR